jgi:hypothetical protein
MSHQYYQNNRIRELEDKLMEMCWQRNIAESKLELARRNWNNYKRQGLIDPECVFDGEQMAYE